jgi:hypothetical protein
MVSCSPSSFCVAIIHQHWLPSRNFYPPSAKKEITDLMAQELFHLLSHFLTPLTFLLLLIPQPPDSDPTPFHRSAIPRDKFVEVAVVKD